MRRPWVRGARAFALGVTRAGLVAVAIAVAAATLGASPARAATTPDTAVTTRDGAAYQGVLVEQIPGDHVTIETADGKIHTFAQSQVASVRPLGPRHVVEPLERRGDSEGVLVDLTAGDPNARLVQLSVSGRGAPAPNPEICGPPCGVRVSPGTYVIGGNGIVPSASFSVPDAATHVRVTADPVTLSHRSTAVILGAGGGIGLLTVGLPMILTGAVLESTSNMGVQGTPAPPGQEAGSAIKWTGLVLSAVCLVAGIAGLVMYQSDTTARVDSTGP
jgi:hypothetical protein